MNRIQSLFERKKQDILSVFLTAGYPELDATSNLIMELDEAGVDLIEIGMPYSDPLADGPTIQHASSVAIDQGMTMDRLFEQVRNARMQSDLPIIYMGYLNQLMQYGYERFIKSCVSSGIDGLIIPDLPIDHYEKYLQKMSEEAGLAISFLITPTTDVLRRELISDSSTGFVYAVADSGITGSTGTISDDQLSYFGTLDQIKAPVLIGFGINDHATFSTACEYAGGAIIGSAFLKALKAGVSVRDFVSDIRGYKNTAVEKHVVTA